MPAQYAKMGISFQYPENWTLDEEDALAGNHSITVYSPGGGFWSVSIHPRATDPRKLAQAAVKALEEEYEGVESEGAEEAVAGWDLVGFDLNFFYLDLTSTAKIRCFRGDAATYSIYCQAEDREFERVHRVFEAMTTSLLSNIKHLRYEFDASAGG